MKRGVFCIFLMSCLMTLVMPSSSARAQLAEKAAAVPASLEVRYELYASAEPESGGQRPVGVLRTFTGYERIHIRNTGARPVRSISLRLYPNSYSSDSTALSERLLRGGDLRLYFARREELGRITQLSFTVDEQPLAYPGFPAMGQTVRVSLPSALAVGDSVLIQTPFLLQLPARLTDLGYVEKTGVSYLKDWFVQVEEGQAEATTEKNVRLHLTLPDSIECRISGRLQEPVSDPARPAVNTYLITMGLHATIMLFAKGAANGGDIPASISVPSAAAFFEKLLPGPLAAKRPLRPDSLMTQMLAARTGHYENIHKPLQPAFLFNLKEADRKKYLSFSPAIGYNDYDQWMPGVLIHNYGLPASRFNFLLAPLYSTGDHSLSGIGRFSFTARHPRHAWQFSLDASHYAFNEYGSWTDGDDRLHEAGKMRLLRIVPALRYKWYPDRARTDKSWTLTARSYILRQDSWVPKEDELFMEKSTTVIGEIKAALKNGRALYPYRVQLKLEGTDQFLRADVTGRYFLNYDAKGNGLQLRGFAGKFFYLNNNNGPRSYTFDNYFYSLSGVTGAQDFTYSHYYVGRNAYEGWMSQQMSVSDGFFKVSTPYQLNPVGQTDDWLAAVNLTSDLPDGINPFSVLPFSLPVRVFADLGTYGDLWSENPAAGRFLYDAGIQVSIIKEAVTIYFPLLYSKVYRDYYKSMGDLGSFGKRIRFSINLGNLLPKPLHNDIKW